MSTTECILANQTPWDISVADHNSSRSNWEQPVAAPGVTIRSGNHLAFGSMRDPPGGTEPDHWGWLYFTSLLGPIANELSNATTPTIYPNVIYTDNITDSLSARLATIINTYSVPRRTRAKP